MIEQLLKQIESMPIPKELVNDSVYFLYSPSKDSCYKSDLKYPESNPIPDDAIKITNENYVTYWCNKYSPPEGKCCEWDARDKCFCWGDVEPPTLEECKEAKLRDITDEYNILVYAGFKSDGVSYESTLENQSRIMMANMSGGGMVVDGGKMVMLTATEANQVFDDMNTYVNSCNERYAKAQSEIEAATTNDQVNAVVL